MLHVSPKAKLSASKQRRQQQSVNVSWCWGSAGTNSDGRHLDHSPFAAAILLRGVGLRVAVPLQLQVEDGMEGLSICSRCLFFSTCVC